MIAFVVFAFAWLLGCAIVLAVLERAPRTREYAFRDRITVDDETWRTMLHAITNPQPPTPAMRALFARPAVLDSGSRPPTPARVLLPLPATLGPRAIPDPNTFADVAEPRADERDRPRHDWLERTECVQTAADVDLIVRLQMQRLDATDVEMRVSESIAGLGSYDVRWACVIDKRDAASTTHVTAYSRARLVSEVRRLWSLARVLRRADSVSGEHDHAKLHARAEVSEGIAVAYDLGGEA